MDNSLKVAVPVFYFFKQSPELNLRFCHLLELVTIVIVINAVIGGIS